jgi:hypothetical protein
MCFSVALWDRLSPHVMGLPFNMFWIMSWIVATPLLMSVVRAIERRR